VGTELQFSSSAVNKRPAAGISAILLRVTLSFITEINCYHTAGSQPKFQFINKQNYRLDCVLLRTLFICGLCKLFRINRIQHELLVKLVCWCMQNNDPHSSINAIRLIKSQRMRWVREYGKIRGARFDGKRPLGRPRRRWEHNIKMEFQEVGMRRHGMEWCGSGYGQVAGCCECGNELPGSIKCREFLNQLSAC